MAKRENELFYKFKKTIFILIVLSLTIKAENINIQDKIYYCSTEMLRDAPLLKIDNACERKPIYKDRLNDSYEKIALLSKDTFEIFGRGYECFKEIIEVKTRENFFFATTREETRIKVELSREQCEQMVETKTCDNRKMTCEEEVCSYEGIPKGEYTYLGSSTESGIMCLTRPRTIKAFSKDDYLFQKRCTSKDLYCKMDRSIIIWPDSINSCPFSFVKYIDLKHVTNGVLYDRTNKLAFRLTDKTNHCQREMFVTTENLYLAPNTAVNDLENFVSNDIKNKTKDLDLTARHELMLSETDGAFYELSKQIESNQIQNCRILSLILNRIKQGPKQKFMTINLDGEERIVYVNRHSILLPSCHIIQNFTLLDTSPSDRCIADFPVRFEFENITMYGMYLTKNRFIKINAERSTCKPKIIHFPNSNTYVRNSVGVNQIFKRSNVVSLIDLYSTKDINFPHLEKLTEANENVEESISLAQLSLSLKRNYQTNKREFPRNETSDLVSIGNFLTNGLSNYLSKFEAVGDNAYFIATWTYYVILILIILTLIFLCVLFIVRCSRMIKNRKKKWRRVNRRNSQEMDDF